MQVGQLTNGTLLGAITSSPPPHLIIRGCFLREREFACGQPSNHFEYVSWESESLPVVIVMGGAGGHDAFATSTDGGKTFTPPRVDLWVKLMNFAFLKLMNFAFFKTMNFASKMMNFADGCQPRPNLVRVVLFWDLLILSMILEWKIMLLPLKMTVLPLKIMIFVTH